MEESLRRNLDELLKFEEIYWRDKSKTHWLDDGDANSYYFYLIKIIHLRYNTIDRICDENHQWLTSRNSTGSSFELYFSNLFASTFLSFSQTLQVFIPKLVTPTMNSTIIGIPTREEIRREAIQMGIYKSAGPDEIDVLLYKRYLNIVGEAVTKKI